MDEFPSIFCGSVFVNLRFSSSGRWLARLAHFSLLALLAWLAGPAAAIAGIAYDAGANRIIVSGYPEERPATLDDVLAADQQGAWGKVAYDKPADTFTLKAALWIGTNTDWGTFFQIGRPDHPREILVLHGDLTVCPPRSSGRRVEKYTDWAGDRYDGRYRVSNRLTIGVFTNTAICPTVKLACSRKNEFAFTVAQAPVASDVSTKDRWYTPIGELYMAHATVTAATPDSNHTYAATICLAHTGVNYRMRDSTLAWWAGDLFKTVFIYARPLDREAQTMRGMVFEHGGSAAGGFDAVDCVFRDLALARAEAGALHCVFEQTRESIRMSPSHLGVILTDCTFGPGATLPAAIPRSQRDAVWLRSGGIYKNVPGLVLNPGLVERISLVVQVQDVRGRPVPGAVVEVDCRNDPFGVAVVRPLAVTGADGRTPADAEGRALVITKREWRPTDDPAAPESLLYVYNLTVSARGFKKHQAAFNGADKIARPLNVTLAPE